MRKRIKEFVRQIVTATAEPAFNPATIGDPLAATTGWTPLKRGGANFRTHKLVEVDADRIEFRASGAARFFYLLFAGLGVFALTIFIPAWSRAGEQMPSFAALIPLAVGSVFVIVGITMFRYGTAPVVFDQRTKHFWKGRQSPHETFNKAEIKEYAEFDQIHALQLIREHVQGNKSSYYSYELNLVLKDGRRVNVVDHGNIEKLRADAERLGAFLKRPVWDAA